MFNKVKSLINNEEKKRMLSNFFSLSILQGANYILPLITLPYLVRVLGAEYFGLLAFATATIAYFQILTDYGFNLTATKEVSIHRDNEQKLVEIYSSVMIIKSLLMVLSFFILCILVFGFEKFYKDYIVYLLTFGIVIGQVMFPVWFFQGMERMKYTTYLNILAKSIFTIAIFIFVKEKSDYYIVPLLTSIGYIISGALSLYIIKKEFGISFKFQSYNTIKKYLIDGWHVFISRFYVSIYTTTNTVVLGLFTNNTIVGYYSIADKIVMAIGGLFETANQAIYPYLSRLYNNSFEYFVDFLKKISIIFITISLVIFICSELLHNLIIYLIAGKHSTQISSILVILLIRVVTSPFGSLFSNALIIMQMKKEFLKVMNYTVVLDLLIVIPSTYYNGLIGLAYSFTLIIVLHVMLLLYYLNKSIISTRNQRLI